MHKLHGRLSDFWSFPIDHEYRIIFGFADANCIYFHTIEKYDIYA